MANSQFTIYSSSDPNGPGLITGQTGSLIRVLNACLVNGYTGKPAAGWTSSLGNLSGSISSYTQPSGSGRTLFVNDMGGNVAAGAKEAWMVGWESMTGLTSSLTAIITGSVGSGYGQFPTPSQLLTTGHIVCRKSATADATGRPWVMFADASTFYLFTSTTDVDSTYFSFWFGDVFSLRGETDLYRCIIAGRTIENSNAGNSELNDAITTTSPPISGVGINGIYMARTWGGGGTSIKVNLIGDYSLVSTNANNTQLPMNSILQMPNGPDGSVYLAPLRVFESAALCLRGRVRGIYQIGHPVASFSDGQTFAGAGDFAGKSFQIVKFSANAVLFVIETSNTLETN